MIKFFRKIRQNLFYEGKTGKYLKYAIGEIALVIIGILLALQINNWNEGRKQNKNIEDLMTVFESELEANIQSCSGLIRLGYRRDSVETLYINDKLTPEIVRDNWQIRRGLGFGTSTRRFIDDNLNELISTEKQLPSNYKLFIPELKELKRRIDSQRKWEQVAVDISISSKKEMTLKFPWYRLRDSLSNELQIEHFLTDPIYKGKLLHYNDYQLDENIWYASLIRTSSVALLWKIRKMKGSAPPKIEDFLEELGLRPFLTKNCDAYPYEVNEMINLRMNFIFYNNRSDTLYFNLTDNKGHIHNSDPMSLPPFSFELDGADLESMDNIQILDKDSCQKIYYRTKQDYLIIN
jgi:hypothetical protein